MLEVLHLVVRLHGQVQNGRQLGFRPRKECLVNPSVYNMKTIWTTNSSVNLDVFKRGKAKSKLSFSGARVSLLYGSIADSITYRVTPSVLRLG